MPDFLHRELRTGGQTIGQVLTAGQECEFVFGAGSCLFSRLPIPIYGTCDARVVDAAGSRWFEFGYRIDAAMTGNAAAGWTDAGNYFRLEPQWSPDLVNWSMGKFSSRPSVTRADGTIEYWSRALNPQDSAIKTGALLISNVNGDPRNNGLTSVIIAGVAQALPNFPYRFEIAGTAAQLQSDLRAAGWAGSIVTGTTATNWSISIPTVNYTSYQQTTRVGFPSYLTEDFFGNLVNVVDHINAAGTFVDAFGTPIFPRAFGRLKITAGTRYDPYL